MASLIPMNYRSRKFLIAFSSFLAVTAMAFFGCWKRSVDGGDIAMIIGAWGVCDAAILKLYNDANIAAAEEVGDRLVGK